MSRIFVSHSSLNNRQARALKQWLSAHRPQLANEIFLDIDPNTGLKVGGRWKSQLFASNSRCELVICLLSREWEESYECKTEYRTAEGLGKQILCVRLDDTTETDIAAEWPRFDIMADGPPTEIELGDGEQPVRFNTTVLNDVRKAVEGTGIGPENFVWPPAEDLRRVPYRGWEPFEEIDAGVFYGRDAAIVRGLDELRALRRSGTESLFVVLGPSGSGKSSYLRAGLIPRLQREDSRFSIVGIMRPERHALTGERGLLNAIGVTDPSQVHATLTELRAAAGTRAGSGPDEAAPTLVLAIDQAEELFSADAEQTDQFLELLTDLARRLNAEEIGLIVLATIRTDRYEAMQSHAALDSVGTVLFNELKPMPATEFGQVITGPAARDDTGPGLHAELVQRLIEDAGEGADTLPLLSLTLARLYGGWLAASPDERPAELGVTDYEAMGGLRDIVDNEIEQILSTEPAERQRELELLRSAFIPWLATINPDNDQPLRRVARYDDLPEASRPLIDALVRRRLLVSDKRDGDVVVEVALESLLRQWDALAGWLRDQRQDLITAEDVQRSDRAWRNHDRDPAWLLTGTRLDDAETLSRTAGFASLLEGVGDYLAASREATEQRRAAEEAARDEELRDAQESQALAEEHGASLSQRSQVLRKALAATAIVAVVALVGALMAVSASAQSVSARQEERARFVEATVVRLRSEALDMLSGTAGSDIQAFNQIIAAAELADTSDPRALIYAAAIRGNTLKVADTAAEAYDVAARGDRIATAEADNTVRLWDAASAQPIAGPLTGHTAPVRAVAFSPDGRVLASASDDHTIRLWNAETGAAIGEPLVGHTAGVNCVAFSPDGRLLISGGDDDLLRLWDVRTGKAIGRPFAGHTDSVFGVAFCQDGLMVASGSRDTTVRLWDPATGEPIGAPLEGHKGGVYTVAFSPDGRRLAVAGGYDDFDVQLWDPEARQPVGAPLVGHSAFVNSVAFSPDGSRLASASDDNTIMQWDPGTGAWLAPPLRGHRGFVNSFAFAGDGHRMVSVGADHTLRLWNIDNPLVGHTDSVTGVAFSPDGTRLATSSYDGTVRLWDVATGRPLAPPLRKDAAAVRAVAFSPDGKLLASGGEDNMVWLWDGRTGAPVRGPLRGHNKAVSSLEFSPDGRLLASGSEDTTVRLWNPETGEPAGDPLNGHTDQVTGLAFSPDGTRLVSVGLDERMRFWDPVHKRSADLNYWHNSGAKTSVAYSPKGDRIAYSHYDNTFELISSEDGMPIGDPVSGHRGAVYSIAYSPDGQLMATGSADKQVRLWTADDGSPYIQPLAGHDDAVSGVAFSPDGHTLASASDDGTVRLWPLATSPEALCGKLTDNMTRAQWDAWISPDIPFEDELCPGLPTHN